MPASYLSRQAPEQVTLGFTFYGPSLAMPQSEPRKRAHSPQLAVGIFNTKTLLGSFDGTGRIRVRP